MRNVVMIALAYVAGCAAGVVAPTPQAFAIAGTVAAVALFAVCAAIGKRPLLAAAVCALAAGWSRAPTPFQETNDSTAWQPCTRTLMGVVARPPAALGDRARLEVSSEAMTACQNRPEPPALAPVRAALSVSVLGDRVPLLAVGDRVLVRGAVKRTPRLRNFGGQSPRSREGLHLAAVAESADSVVRLARDPVDVGAGLAAIRERISSFWRSNLAAPLDGLARALVIGESGALDPAQRERFRRTGTAHLVAVSGLHLAILTWICFGVLKWCLLRVEPLARRVEVGRVAAVLTIPVLLAFSALVGGQPPVARSCVMATGVLLGRALVRRSRASDALAIAAAALLAFDPADIADPGFQLSFAAVASFFLGAGRGPRVDSIGTEEPTRRQRAWRRVSTATKRLFFGSLAATAATTPIALYHFDQVSIVAVPCNMIAIPFTTALIMPALFLLSAVAIPAPGLAAYGAPVAEWLLRAFDAGLAWAGSPDCVAIAGPEPLVAIAIVACCGAALATVAFRGPRSACALLAAIVLAGAAICAQPAAIPTGRFVLDFLDVGQGSATLATFPDGTQWLIDAGGSASSPERFGELHLVPVLRGLGVRALDTVIISHPDPDHVIGGPAVLRAFPVRRVWAHGRGAAAGEDEEADASYLGFLDEAERLGVATRAPQEICGEETIAGVRAAVLHPCGEPLGFDPMLSANDNSLVVRFEYGLASFLLPGDLSREGEERLLGRRLALASDVLALGHHGSDSSSSDEFLDAVRPAVAVASVGLDNRWGFPRRTVIASLRRRGVGLRRTDRDGGVRVVSDGMSIAVSVAAAPADQ
jgi:competence protein ComEC